MERARFEELALEQIDAVYRMALQLARRPDEAADLVQETYLKAFKAADRYEQQGGGVRPWLFKIIHNVFYTRLARSKRESSFADDQAHAELGVEPAETAPVSALADLDWEHVDDRIKSAIDRLKPEYRTVLLLWGVEGLKYREIAEIENVPIGTVMSRLHRARAILAEELAELAEENRMSSG